MTCKEYRLATPQPLTRLFLADVFLCKVLTTTWHCNGFDLLFIFYIP